jgi:hypothetical protein
VGGVGGVVVVVVLARTGDIISRIAIATNPTTPRPLNNHFFFIFYFHPFKINKARKGISPSLALKCFDRLILL